MKTGVTVNCLELKGIGGAWRSGLGAESFEVPKNGNRYPDEKVVFALIRSKVNTVEEKKKDIKRR
jgi:hypothetical protein